MGVADLLSPQRIELNLPFRDKQAVLERLVELEGYGDAILDLEAFRRDMMAREAQGGTAVEAGVAVPHAKSGAVRYPSLAVVTLREGIDCGALDGVPSDGFFYDRSPCRRGAAHGGAGPADYPAAGTGISGAAASGSYAGGISGDCG